MPITLAEYDLIVDNIKKEHKTDLIKLCDEAQSRVNQVYANVIKFGRENDGIEILYALDSLGGKSLINPVQGKKGCVDSEELRELLTNAEPNSVIVIHNHPNNASFSAVDFYSAEKYISIALTSAIGHDGSIYELRIGNNRDIPLEQLQNRYYELKAELPVINDYTVYDLIEREQMLRNDVVETMCGEYGWEYRRAYYYDKPL